MATPTSTRESATVNAVARETPAFGIQFSEAQLLAWLAASLYPFFRIVALIGAAPIIGNAMVPRRVRIGLALFITVVVAGREPAGDAHGRGQCDD